MKVEREMDQMSDEIKRVKRELKFKGKIIDFYQDTMEINGDHTVIWDFIKHKGAAAVVPVTDEGKDPDGKAVPECSGTLYTGDPGGSIGYSG